MKSPSNVIVSAPPPAFVRPVLATEGDVPATAASVPDVRRIVFQSTGRERAEKARGVRKQAMKGDDQDFSVSDHAAKKMTQMKDDLWNGTAW
jgi:hypothetical protein